MSASGTGLTPARSHADLDRRVVLEDGAVHRVSELRDRSCLVILGGPGAGKSAVLEREARHDGVKVVRVRAGLRSPATFDAKRLYLDALDEFRSAGHPGDRLDEILIRLQAERPDRLVLGCRADDWRGAADRAELATIYPDVAVGRLLPLEGHEAEAILEALGHAEPGVLLDAAERAGLGALLATPLSVTLLYEVVKTKGDLPSGRGGLYESAALALVQEFDGVLRTVRPRLPDDATLLDAAGRVCLAFVVTEAEYLCRYVNPMSVVGTLTPGQLAIDDVPAEPDLVDRVLGTGLFQGDGVRFEPLHRSIAEYLAARLLVHRCTAMHDAVPFERILGLMTGADGRAPSGLRGLFAWCAALLGKAGQTELACRLVRIDPVTVLLHGDVGLLGDDERRVLLEALGEADEPFFRIEDAPEALLGGLVSPALAPDVERLLSRSEPNHLRITLFDALTYGPPVPALVPVLRSIVLDATEYPWARERAVGALLSIAERPQVERRWLRCALRSAALTESRFAVQMALATRCRKGRLPNIEALQVIADHGRCDPDGYLLRLFPLDTLLREDSGEALFDAMPRGWRGPATGDFQTDDVDELLGELLAQLLDAPSDPTAVRLARWLARMGFGAYGSIPGEMYEAVRRWAERGTGSDRRRALFVEMTCGREPTSGSYSAYRAMFDAGPDPDVLEALVDALPDCTDPEARRACADTLALSACDLAADDPWRRRCIAALAAAGETELARHLECRSLPKHDAHVGARDRHQRAERARADAAQRTAQRVHLQANIDALRAGERRATGTLWSLLNRIGHEPWSDVDPGARLAELVGSGIAEATMEGWRSLARGGDVFLTLAEMGEGGVRGTRYGSVELIAAGAELLVREGQWTAAHEMSCAVACAVLVESEAHPYRVGDRTCSLAVERLCSSTDGRQALSALWAPYRHAVQGRTLPGFRQVEKHAVASVELGAECLALLTIFERCPGRRLTDLLRLTLRIVGPTTLATTVWTTLDSLPHPCSARFDWLHAAFALDPERALVQIEAIDGVDGIDRVVDPYLRDGPREGDPLMPDTDERAAQRCRLLAPVLLAQVLPESPGFGTQGGVDASDQVRKVAQQCLQGLATGVDDEDGLTLEALLAEPSLTPWHPRVQSALARFRRARRDARFQPATPSDLEAVLDGGPPSTPSDVAAVGRIELGELALRIRDDDVLSWREFWVRPAAGSVIKLLGENDCRDLLVQKMRARLERYGVPEAVPEVQRQGATRVDILLRTPGAGSYPIEVKRADNENLWTAPAGQLAGYARHPEAGGLGAYVVLWSGTGSDVVRGHPEHGQPASIDELRVWLREITPPELDLFVFDLSDPAAAKRVAGKPRRGGIGVKKQGAIKESTSPHRTRTSGKNGDGT